MWQELVEFIKSVPDVIWSGIVASGITFLGVMLSNGSNTKRLKLQLDHDAQEKSKEKISNLRREVYLRAIEDVEITNIKLGTLATRDFSNLNMALELESITASMAKLRLVAEPDTARLAGELSAAFGVLFLKLLPRIVPIQNAKNDIEVSDAAYVSSFAEACRVMREIHKFNEEGRKDIEIFQVLQRSYDFFFEQSQKHASARALAYDIHGAKLREFNISLMPDMKELARLQLKVMVAIRSDLGIAGDASDFQLQLERRLTVMEAEFGNAMSKLGEE